jgi:hypothetical protein
LGLFSFLCLAARGCAVAVACRAGDDFYEVLAGLDEGENVVTQGALLIDAQAQVAHSAQGPAPAAGHDHAK